MQWQCATLHSIAEAAAASRVHSKSPYLSSSSLTLIRLQMLISAKALVWDEVSSSASAIKLQYTTCRYASKRRIIARRQCDNWLSGKARHAGSCASRKASQTGNWASRQRLAYPLLSQLAGKLQGGLGHEVGQGHVQVQHAHDHASSIRLQHLLLLPQQPHARAEEELASPGGHDGSF